MPKRGFNNRLREFLDAEGIEEERTVALLDRFFPPNRPPQPLSLEELESLGRLQCTNSELGAYFGLTERQIISRRATDSELDEAIKRGQNQGRISLRRQQFAAALDGDRTMLVWLGKNVLGQRDSGIDLNISGSMSFDNEEIRPLLDSKMDEFVRSRKGNGEDREPPEYH